MNPRALIALAVVIVATVSFGFSSNRHRVPGYTEALVTVTDFTHDLNERQAIALGRTVRVSDLVNANDASAVLDLALTIRTARNTGHLDDLAFSKARELYWSQR